MVEFGYVLSGNGLKPKWDSDENRNAVSVMLKATLRKCKCKKTKCNPAKRQCVCRRTDPPSRCTSLCVCSSECMNQSYSEDADAMQVDTAQEDPTYDTGKFVKLINHLIIQ